MKKAIVPASVIFAACLLWACGAWAQLRVGGPSRPQTPVPPGPTMVFESGFESNVALSAPADDGAGSYIQQITGADRGYTWTTSMPQRVGKQNWFGYEVPLAGYTLSDYAETRIDTVTGYNGGTTKALYMALKGLTGLNPEPRDQFHIFPASAQTQLYMKYRVKLQPDLATALPSGGTWSLIISEAFETGADFRWNLRVQRTPSPSYLYWRAQSQTGTGGGDPQVWECTSGVTVPLGEWFTFEQFWKQGVGTPGTSTAGRVWYAVNGVTIVDYNGRTQTDNQIDIFWPWKLYVGNQLLFGGGQTFYHWIDDVEIRDDIPQASLNPSVPAAGTNTCTTF